MPNIHATLHLHEEEDFKYWKSKPIDRYELVYTLNGNDSYIHLYNSSINNLFKDFFKKAGRFDGVYHLDLPQALNIEQQERIRNKFETARTHFLRKFLNLNKKQPLPTGPALEQALQAAAKQQKKTYKRFLKKQIIEVNQATRKLHILFATLGSLFTGGVAIAGIAIAAGLLALSPTVMPIMVIAATLAVSSGLFYLGVSKLHQHYVKNAKKIIDSIPVPETQKALPSKDVPTQILELGQDNPPENAVSEIPGTALSQKSSGSVSPKKGK